MMMRAPRLITETPFPSGLARAFILGTASVGGSMVYIYALRDPQSGSIRYVGKTKNIATRLSQHIAKAKGGHTNHHCAHWIRSLLSRGLVPEIFVLREVCAHDDWKQAESDAIRSCRAAGHDLTNLTAGGDGFHECHPSVISRRVASRRVTLSDPERKAQFVASLTAARQRPDVRQRHSAGAVAAWNNPTTREKFLGGMRAPARASASEKAAAFYADPEQRKAAGDASRKRWSLPGAKERHAEQLRARWARRKLGTSSE